MQWCSRWGHHEMVSPICALLGQIRHDGPDVPGELAGRLELEIPLVGAHGFLLASEPLEDGAEEELGAGVLRVQLRRLLERLDGAAQLIAFEEGIAEREQRGHRIGTQLDRLAELGDVSPLLAPLEPRLATRERPPVARLSG